MHRPAPSAERKPGPWIISPLWDAALLIGAPLAILPIVLLLVERCFTAEQVSLVVVSFASIGHHLPGFMRAYGDRELFQRFRWRFLLAPPLALAGIGFFVWRDLHGLELMLLFWATWHVLMQTYGFMRIYDLKLGRREPAVARLDFALCLAIFTAGVVFSDPRMYGIAEVLWQCGVPTFGREWLDAARWVVGIATGLVLAMYAARMILDGRASRAVNWAKLCLALTTAGLFWICGATTQDILVGVAMFEIFHAAQYYAIVWAYNRRLAERVGRGFGPLGFLFRDRWAFVGVYVAAIVAFGSIRFFGDRLREPAAQKTLLALLSASTLLHFYYDGFIWKVSQAKTQINLDIIGAAAGEDRRLRWSHAAKWGAFATIACALLALEIVRAPPKALNDSERLDALLNWTPRVPELQSRISRDALLRGDADLAVQTARQALAARPRSSQAHADLALALLAGEHYGGAAAEFREATRLSPGEWENFCDLGSSLGKLGQWAESASAFGQAATLSPRNSAIERSWAKMCAARGDQEAAIEHWQSAHAAAPASRAIGEELVAALTGAARHEEAVRLAADLAKASDDLPARLLLAKALIGAERYEEALACLDGQGKSSDSTEFAYQRGLANLRLGRFEASGAALGRALQLSPKDAMVHFQLGNLAYMTGDLDGAARSYRRTLDLAPQFAEGYNNLGATLFAQQDWEHACTAYRQAIKYAPDNAESHYNLGLLLLNNNDSETARRHIRRAVELGQTAAPEVLKAVGL